MILLALSQIAALEGANEESLCQMVAHWKEEKADLESKLADSAKFLAAADASWAARVDQLEAELALARTTTDAAQEVRFRSRRCEPREALVGMFPSYTGREQPTFGFKAWGDMLQLDSPSRCVRCRGNNQPWRCLLSPRRM